MSTYLFTVWEGAGLVPAEMAVAGRLARRGHRVEVLGDPSTAEAARAAGAAFRTWTAAPHRASERPEDDPARDWESPNPVELMRRMREHQLIGPAPGQAADTLAAIDDIAPDVVVSDHLHLGPQVAAQSAGLPAVSLIPNGYPFPVRGIPPFSLGWQPATGPLTRTRDRVGRAALTWLWDKGLPEFNRLRTDLGLPVLTSVFDHPATLDRQLVLTSDLFDLTGDLPPNVVYTGAELADPSWSQPWQAPPGDGPLVLVALSSGYQNQAGLLRRIIDALDSTHCRGVVTTGRVLDPADFPAGSRVCVVRSAPHRQVLAQAAAVITHGGHGITMKALHAGVPQLIMPMGRDQPDNAVRAHRLGVAMVRNARNTPEEIRRGLTALLTEDHYRAAARDVARQVNATHDPSLATEEIERLGSPQPTARHPHSASSKTHDQTSTSPSGVRRT